MVRTNFTPFSNERLGTLPLGSGADDGRHGWGGIPWARHQDGGEKCIVVLFFSCTIERHVKSATLVMRA